MGKTIVPIDVLKRRYEAGETFRQIAKDYPISFQALAQQYARAGGIPRPRRMRKYFPMLCPTCGEPFVPRNKVQRFCSQQCVPAVVRSSGNPKRDVCKRGHPLTPDNLYSQHGKTPPRCKTCAQAAQRAYWRRRHGNGT